MSLQADQTLDAKGMSCPIPVVKAKTAMDGMSSGQILQITATDQGAKNDLPAWAKSSGHALLQELDEDDVLKFWIKKR